MLNRFRKNFRFYYLPLAGVFAAAIVFIAGITYLSSRPNSEWDVPTQRYIASQSSTPAVKIQPIDLTGIWQSDNPRARFVATITNKSIDIDMETESGSLAYYSGSFEFPMQPVGKIQSMPDSTRLTWSSATSKEFTYLDGTIAFDYVAPGIKSGIVLRKKG